jgi:zinc transporter ZupT
MENKHNPLTAMIFLIGILCAFVIAIPFFQGARSLGYLAILLLMMAMSLLYIVLRNVIKRIDRLDNIPCNKDSQE